MIQNSEKKPDCGAGYRRLVVYERTARNQADVLDAFSGAIAAEGWRRAECVTTVERCFQTRKYFIAATTPDAHGPDLGGFPAAPPGSTDVVVAVLEPN